jgi:uncharacterized membrane protein
MNIGDYLTFGYSKTSDFVSWLFVISMFIKISSTGILLLNSRMQFLKFHTAESIWWLTKISALSLCLAALLACKFAGDLVGESVFSWLLIAATVLVFFLGIRRFRMLRTRIKLDL